MKSKISIDSGDRQPTYSEYLAKINFYTYSSLISKAIEIKTMTQASSQYSEADKYNGVATDLLTAKSGYMTGSALSPSKELERKDDLTAATDIKNNLVIPDSDIYTFGSTMSEDSQQIDNSIGMESSLTATAQSFDFYGQIIQDRFVY